MRLKTNEVGIGHLQAAVSALLVVACLVGGGLAVVDDGFVRRSTICDLGASVACFSDPSMLGSSAIGLTRWRSGGELVATLGAVVPGDLIKAKLCSPSGPQEVALWVDDTPVTSFTVDATWRQQEIVLPCSGRQVIFRRAHPTDPGIDLSRLSLDNTVGHATGFFAATVRSRLAPVEPHRLRPSGWLAVIGLPLALLLALARLAWRRGSPSAVALRAAALTLGPSAAVVVAAAAVSSLSPYRISCPSSTFAALLLVLVALTLAVCWRRELAAVLRRLPTLLASLAASSALDLESWRPTTARVVAAGCLAALAAVEISLLPRSPFEWDELLFLKALDHFDVAAHSPHPPGYPVFVAAGHLVNAVVGDPVRSLQLVSVIGTLLTVLGVAAALRRLGASRATVGLAGVVLVCLPAFAFHANVGMSDALATGLACLALWACAACLTDPDGRWWLLAAAVFAALAAGTRPQVGVALAGPGLWVIWRNVSDRRWGRLLAAVVAFMAVTAACWVPVVALTGWERYWNVIRSYREWIALNETAHRLPQAPLDRLADAWLVQPFGPLAVAALLWALVLAGGIAWWRAGHRRLVLGATLSGVGYLLVAMWRLQYDASVRYVNPALPGLAALVAGVTVVRRPLARRALVAAACLLALFQGDWGAPAYLLRAGEVAPASAILTWVRDNADPHSTQVVFHGGLRPHATYLLGSSLPASWGFDQEGAGTGGRRVWAVGPLGWTGTSGLLHRDEWSSERLRRLSRDRYWDCAVVQRRPAELSPLAQPLPPGRWTLTARRSVRLDPTSGPSLLRVTTFAGVLVVERRGAAVITLAPGSRAELPLALSADDVLELVATGGAVELQAELVADGGGLPSAPWRLVPSVAHSEGREGSSWTSDLELVNPSSSSASCRLVLVPSGADGTPTVSALLPVPAGGRLLLRDVVQSVFAARVSGAVAVATDNPDVEISSTMDHVLPGDRHWPVAVPIATAADLIDAGHAGTVDLPAEDEKAPLRLNLGVVNLSHTPAQVVAEVSRAAAGATSTLDLELPPTSYRVVQLPPTWRGTSLTVRLTGGDATIVAHLSSVEQTGGGWSFVPIVPTGRRSSQPAAAR